MLYFDPRLSKNHDVSCNTCHGLDTYGVDGKVTSEGHKKQRGGRNSPTVYNAAGHFAQFWDGRAADVEAQALGPMTNPVEMAMASGEQVTAVLRTIPGYAEHFAKAFPGVSEPVTYENAGKAIAAFERKLVTPSRWDAFLGGKSDALTAAEKDGFNAFIDAGCMACHTGAFVGGGMYQKLGLVKPWPGLEDTGRFEATNNEADKGFFKVPSLRNIARTGPYFHDGKVAELSEAVTMMARHQLGKELSAEQVGSIVTWLNALTGDLPPAELISAPELPPNGPETPAPDPG
jgi:cytochrome c peroxidase